jgi:hypothetical protein
MLANVRIAVRYAETVASAAARCWSIEKARSRPATTTLAVSRLRSHSNGPTLVSSKSLTSKTSRRSGVPKIPKFERCASPQSCA